MRIGQDCALVVVDAQRDFVSGSLAVPLAAQAIDVIDRLVSKFYNKRLTVAYTMDWHPPGHCSFMTHGGLWPPHCVQGSMGSHIVAKVLDQEPNLFKKGMLQYSDCYSGFGALNDETGEDLQEWLTRRFIDRLIVCGIATDYCVRATALEAASMGFEVVLVTDAIASVTLNTGERAIKEMINVGVRLRNERQIGSWW